MSKEIEVGDYIRTKNGIIKTVAEVTESGIILGNKERLETDNFRPYINKNKIAKLSKNIIDLIEVGDYVNGYRIERLDNFAGIKTLKSILNKSEDTFDILNEEIETVLTKEQFLANEYKVEVK